MFTIVENLNKIKDTKIEHILNILQTLLKIVNKIQITYKYKSRFTIVLGDLVFFLFSGV